MNIQAINSFLLTVIVGGLMACGGEGQGVADVTAPRVGSLVIQEPFFTDTDNRHTGCTLTLEVDVRDTDGNRLVGVPISWTSSNPERAVIWKYYDLI